MALRRHIADHGRTYGKYAVIGAIAGVATIAAREAFAAVLPADTPVYYASSVVLAYAVGIGLSYYGHGAFTFRRRRLASGALRRFSRFVVIAVLGLVATTALALGVRYGLGVDMLLGRYGAGFAFALATFLASVLTYTLNSWYTFGARFGREGVDGAASPHGR